MNHVKIKICGLRREEDIEAVNQVLPEYIGFVFAESKRQIDMTLASKLKDRLDNRIQTVGVFVNHSVEFIQELYQNQIIDLIQLHGDEDAEFIRHLRTVCSGRIIKAVNVGGEMPILPETADYLLFDKASGQRGGTGEVFDWNILSDFQKSPFFLAGGLTPENAREAVQSLRPYAMDVSSGVETNGFKDPEKIYKFVQNVRGTMIC